MNTLKTVLNNDYNKGTLFLVATPLGNIEDFSARALRVLEEVDFILAEDTKRAGLLLAKCNIKSKEIFSLNEHNEKEKTTLILRKLGENKNIALISDAGMPIICDPGYLLVNACHEHKFRVTVIPGASAPLIALAASGIAPLPFTFLGFLPRQEKDKEKTLFPFAQVQSSLIFFERKDRVFETLTLCLNLLGNRDVCICRELTKIHEEFIHIELNEIANYKDLCDELLGEITIVLSPPKEQALTSSEELDRIIEEERAQATSPRNLAKRVQARVLGWKTSDIYNRL